jgi:TPR repeat protein
MNKSYLGLILMAALAFGSISARAQSGMDSFGAWDAPSRFFPGKYFEQKAQFYLKNRQYRAAIEMFELSGFWADKISQYNAGLMYYNGMGVPADKARGIAWLRIAAQGHEELAERALQVAQGQVSVAERHRADAIFDQLDQKYGDRYTLPRALAQFDQDAAMLTGSHLGHVIGPLSVQQAGDLPTTGEDFARQISGERDQLISKIRGHVTVGSVTQLNVPQDAKANVSHTPLDTPPPPPSDAHG